MSNLSINIAFFDTISICKLLEPLQQQKSEFCNLKQTNAHGGEILAKGTVHIDAKFRNRAQALFTGKQDS